MNASPPNPIREIPGLKFEREMGVAARPVLAHFFTSWSEPCRLLAPVLEALADELGDDLEVVAVNLDHCPELARRVGVTAIPALLLFADGQPICALDTAMPLTELKAELHGLLADYGKSTGTRLTPRPFPGQQARKPAAGDFSISALVELPFEQALIATRRALLEEKLIVIAEIDLQAELAAKLRQQIRPYAILGVWEPTWEYEALSREPDIGLLMPTHVCLWDNGDATCTLATADLKHLCHVEDNPPLAGLRAVLASVQFAHAPTGHRPGAHGALPAGGQPTVS